MKSKTAITHLLTCKPCEVCQNIHDWLTITPILSLILRDCMHNSVDCVHQWVVVVCLTCFHWTFPINKWNGLPIDADHEGNCLRKSALCAIDPSLTLTQTYISCTLLASTLAWRDSFQIFSLFCIVLYRDCIENICICIYHG